MLLNTSHWRGLVRLAVGVLLLAMLGPIAALSWGSTPTRIAAASDLRFAMDEIVTAFRADHPESAVEVIYGSSGRFRTQIEHGAPFDLYFSADIAYPEALKAAGLTEGPVLPYALGRIVLWSSTRDASGLTLEDLASTDFRRIAIANPRHAPYGVRAREALQAAGVWEAVEARLVYGESISHALQLVQSGAADVGIIALALALHPAIEAQGGYALIDEDLHQPLAQGFVITRRGADNPTARLFADYVQQPAARRILRQYGFVLPGED
jgi:molybdate transport system substrate-binding protein